NVSPLWHTLDMQNMDAPVANVLLWYGAAGGTSNDNTTEGVNSALYASATNTGLFAGAGTPYATIYGYWVNPRGNPTGSPAGSTGWDSDYGKYATASAASPPLPVPSEANGPCADPLAVGYPCFAPGSMPITLVFTDNPGEGGPGGLF